LKAILEQDSERSFFVPSADQSTTTEKTSMNISVLAM